MLWAGSDTEGEEWPMSMPRSDLPHVSKLDPRLAHEMVEAMGEAFDKAEHATTGVSYTATWVEMLEAALNAASKRGVSPLVMQ
jgi:hypothetical protein